MCDLVCFLCRFSGEGKGDVGFIEHANRDGEGTR